MSRLTAAALGALVLTVLVAGCGGSSSSTTTSTTSATQTWANGVCSAFAAWKASLQQVNASLADRGSISKNTLTTAVADVSAANQQLAASVDDLTRPPAASGEQATDTVDTLRGQLESGWKSIQSMVVSPDASQPLATISRVTGTLATMGTQVQTAVADIQQLDVKGELSGAFVAAPACKPFLQG